jgi:hypothetical protein
MSEKDIVKSKDVCFLLPCVLRAFCSLVESIEDSDPQEMLQVRTELILLRDEATELEKMERAAIDDLMKSVACVRFRTLKAVFHHGYYDEPPDGYDEWKAVAELLRKASTAIGMGLVRKSVKIMDRFSVETRELIAQRFQKMHKGESHGA